MGSLHSRLSSGTDDLEPQEPIGLISCKESLKTHILNPLQHPKFYGGCVPVKRILTLFGPKGCGKRSLIQWFCHNHGIRCHNVNSEESMSYMKRKINDATPESAHTVFLIDDINNLNAKIIPHLAECAENLRSVSSPTPYWIVFICQDLPYKLDQTLRKLADVEIYVPTPSDETRKIIFERMLRAYDSKTSTSNDIQDSEIIQLVSCSCYFTVSEIIDFCKTVFNKTVNEGINESSSPHPLQWDDFEKSMVETSKHGLCIRSDNVTGRYEMYREFIGKPICHPINKKRAAEAADKKSGRARSKRKIQNGNPGSDSD